MTTDIVPGFSALKMKEEVQARVEAELASLPPDERLYVLRSGVEEGPLSDWWSRLQPEEGRAKQIVELLHEAESRVQDDKYAVFRDELNEMIAGLLALRPWLDHREGDIEDPQIRKHNPYAYVVALFRNRLDAMR